MQITKETLKKAITKKTGCTIQHDGWPCGTCFFAIDDSLTNRDWQTFLYFRGSDIREELDNLPDSLKEIEEIITKIYNLCKKQ